MFPLLSVDDFALFFLVLGRVAGLLAAIPFFGAKTVPARVKALLALMLTITLFPVLKVHLPQEPLDSLGLGLIVIKESLIGITLGFLAQGIFVAVEFCGQLLSMQIGFGASTMIDPTAGHVSILSLFQRMLAMLFFLTLGIHHIFIKAIVESYEVVPIGAWHVSGSLMNFLIATTAGIFVLAIKLAAPVMVALMLSTVALGIMARAFPQMNVFMMSFPLNISIGFTILGASIFIFRATIEGAFGVLTKQISELFKLLA